MLYTIAQCLLTRIHFSPSTTIYLSIYVSNVPHAFSGEENYVQTDIYFYLFIYSTDIARVTLDAAVRHLMALYAKRAFFFQLFLQFILDRTS